MSLCIVLQTKNVIYMSGDSRESTIRNGEPIATGRDCDKIHQIGDKVIFAAGSAYVVTSILSDFTTSADQSIEHLKTLAKKHKALFIETYGPDYLGKTHHADFLIGCIENGNPVLYGLSSEDDFRVLKRVGSMQMEVAAAGCHVSKAMSFFNTEAKYGGNINDIYQKIYHHLACEEIGGTLSVFEISSVEIKKRTFPIKDSREVKTVDHSKRIYNSDEMFFKVKGENVFWLDAIGETLKFSGHLEAASGTFRGELQAATGTFTGDLSAAGGTFTGTLQGVDGNFSGTISASTITGSTISGGTVTGTIVNGGQVNGAQINGGTINVDTDMYIGKKLYMNPSSYTSDIVFSPGITIYGDPSGGGLFLSAFGGVRLNGMNVVSEINGLLARVAALEAGS